MHLPAEILNKISRYLDIETRNEFRKEFPNCTDCECLDNENSVTFSLLKNHMKCFHLAISRKHKLTIEAFTTAIKMRNFEAIKALCDNNCQRDHRCTAAAGERGDLEILKYIYECDTPVDSYTFAITAANGNIKCIEYLQSIECHADFRASMWAIKNGQIEMLKWLKLHKYPITLHSYNLCASSFNIMSNLIAEYPVNTSNFECDIIQVTNTVDWINENLDWFGDSRLVPL